MAMIRWSPLEEMSLLRNQIDRIFEPASSLGEKTQNRHYLPVEVTERADSYQIRLLVPGLEPEQISRQIKIDATGKELNVTAKCMPRELGKDETVHINEFHYGEFSRHLSFPQAINVEGIEAEYALGVLNVTVPKMESARARQVEIKIRS